MMDAIYSVYIMELHTICGGTKYFSTVKCCGKIFAILLNCVRNYIVSSIKPNVP